MKFVVTLAFLVCLFQIGICYQCFECSGSTTTPCGVEFDDETTKDTNCNGDCLKVHYDVNGETFYKRGCAGKDGCEQIKKELNVESLPCQTCSGNFCNNGP